MSARIKSAKARSAGNGASRPQSKAIKINCRLRSASGIVCAAHSCRYWSGLAVRVSDVFPRIVFICIYAPFKVDVANCCLRNAVRDGEIRLFDAERKIAADLRDYAGG